MDLKGDKVVVVGTGISGIGAARLLAKTQAKVVLYDSNEKVSEKDVYAKLPDVQVEVVIGTDFAKVLEGAKLLVISPGVPIDSEAVLEANRQNIPVWGEIELAYNYEKGTVVAITGTNGKTTTTALVGEIIKNHIKNTYVVGNIGNSYTGEVLKTDEDSVTVAEISSFQLETTHDFRPHVSAILNITPDHLNRHKTMENYIKVKESITKNQTQEDVCVLNYDDEVLRAFGAKECGASVLFFSRLYKIKNGICMNNDDIVLVKDGKETALMNVNDMKLIGKHNYENVMAAIGIAMSMGIPMDIIISTVKEFKAVEHRIEYVRELNGVVYYNDSKGTNTDAAIKAIEAMTRPTILIGGGYDKHSEYDDWVLAFKDRAKHLILLGATRNKIAECAKKHGYDKITFVSTLSEAVSLSAKIAESGDAVLLSPACASWDMFESYEQRGKMFKEYVNQLN